MKPWIRPSRLSRRPLFEASPALSLATIFFALAPCVFARPQEQPGQPAPAIAEVARNAREQKSNSTKHLKVITNDNLVSQSPSPETSPNLKTSTKSEAEAATPQTPDCSNPSDADRLKMELESAQDERDQIRRELSYQPTIISGGNLDLRNFKPGSSGVNLGSPPLIETQPPAPERITEGVLNDKIESLTRTLQIACAPPEEAAILKKLGLLEEQLRWAQREFALNQDAYYSQTNYAQDTAGKTKLDAEQEQIDSLQSEIQRLKDELPAPKTD